MAEQSLGVNKRVGETTLYVNTRPLKLKGCFVITLFRHECHPSISTPTETEMEMRGEKKRINMNINGDDQLRRIGYVDARVFHEILAFDRLFRNTMQQYTVCVI